MPDTTPYREARRVDLAVNPAISDVQGTSKGGRMKYSWPSRLRSKAGRKRKKPKVIISYISEIP